MKDVLTEQMREEDGGVNSGHLALDECDKAQSVREAMA